MKNSLNSRLAQNTLIHKMCLSQHYKGFLNISHFNISHRIYKHSILHFAVFKVEWEYWEKNKPIVVYVVLALLGLALVIANIHNTSKQQAHLKTWNLLFPYATTPKQQPVVHPCSSDEELILNPIIDLSGWQLPQDIDYDVLSNHIWCYYPASSRWITD